jgi:hypothetical protein
MRPSIVDPSRRKRSFQMRCLTSLGLSLAAAVALAGFATPAAHAGGPKSQTAKKHSGHLCSECQLRAAIEKSGGAPIVIQGPDLAAMPPGATGGCASCAAAAAAGGPVYITAGGEMPGVATLGGPSAPGIASLNGPIGNEPVPIGVVQASYSQGGNPAATGAYTGRAGSFDPTHGDPRVSHALGTPMPGRNGVPISGMPGSMGGPVSVAPDGPAKRPRVLSTLFGLEGLGDWRRSRADRAAQAHAMIPMGNVTARPRATSVPASAVYGQ